MRGSGDKRHTDVIQELKLVRGTMKALVQYAPGEIRLEEIAIPRPGAGEVLVKVLGAGVCGTDPHRKMRKHPAIPGHEFAGKVVEVGANVTKVNTGTLVVVAPLPNTRLPPQRICCPSRWEWITR